jgi:hypothetical protein
MGSSIAIGGVRRGVSIVAKVRPAASDVDPVDRAVRAVEAADARANSSPISLRRPRASLVLSDQRRVDRGRRLDLVRRGLAWARRVQVWVLHD